MNNLLTLIENLALINWHKESCYLVGDYGPYTIVLHEYVQRSSGLELILAGPYGASKPVREARHYDIRFFDKDSFLHYGINSSPSVEIETKKLNSEINAAAETLFNIANQSAIENFAAKLLNINNNAPIDLKPHYKDK